MKIKVAEMFYSLQGEGKFIGVPSIFLRTFGCNFSCSGFGMPKGEKSVEHINIDPLKYQKYDDLPLVNTGCDSYASWDIRFKHLSPILTTDVISKHLLSLLPFKTWDLNQSDIHLIITGGEPLLGWQKAYPDLLSQPEMQTLKNLTFETNGTQLIQPNVVDYFNKRSDLHVTYSVSAKLSQSGELWENAIKPHVVKRYLEVMNCDLYFKFVVGTLQDFEEVHRAVEEYSKVGIVKPVYVMPVGGTDMLYYKNNQWVANEALKHGYRYSPRLQVDIWRNAWGT